MDFVGFDCCFGRLSVAFVIFVIWCFGFSDLTFLVILGDCAYLVCAKYAQNIAMWIPRLSAITITRTQTLQGKSN